MTDETETQTRKIGCGIIFRYPVLSIIVFAIIGICCGIGLSTWDPEPGQEDAKTATIQWLGLIGALFIRSLTCFVLPLVFVTVTISMVDMLKVGKASSVGWFVIGIYTLTTLLASVIAILAAAVFSPLFHTEVLTQSEILPEVRLACDTSGHYMTEGEDGTLTCAAGTGGNSTFLLEDLNGYFAVNSGGGPQNDIGLSDQLYDGVFMKLFTKNIFLALTQGNFAAVVVFAMIFGAALGIEMMNNTPKRENSMEALTAVLADVDKVFVKMLTWVIALTPLAVWSLITSALGKQTDLADKFRNVGLLIASVVFGYIIQISGVYIGLSWLLTKKNPIPYLRKMAEAQVMAISCASSAATLPITMKCVEGSKEIPEPVWRFVLPLGATINMDGTAAYIVCACVWMATLNGIPVTAGNYVLLAILATLGSAGAAPVPQASLVLIITTYNTTFNTTGTPNGFDFIVAVDWFVDRLRTCINVTSDTVVCRMVAALTKVDEADAALVGESVTDNPISGGLTKSMAIEQEKALQDIDEKYAHKDETVEKA